MKVTLLLGILGILLSFQSQAKSFKSNLVSIYNVGTSSKPIAQAIVDMGMTSEGINHASSIALRSDGVITTFDNYQGPNVTGQFLGKFNSGTKGNVVLTSIFKIKMKFQSPIELKVKETVVLVSENGDVKLID